MLAKKEPEWCWCSEANSSPCHLDVWGTGATVGAQTRSVSVISLAQLSLRTGQVLSACMRPAEQRSSSWPCRRHHHHLWNGKVAEWKAPTSSLICISCATYYMPSRGVLSGGLLGELHTNHLSSSNTQTIWSIKEIVQLKAYRNWPNHCNMHFFINY